MSKGFVVEAAGRAVGLAVRCRGGFRFFASEPMLQRFESRVFPRFRALIRAITAAYPDAGGQGAGRLAAARYGAAR